MGRKYKGFTLIELLVVIAIIAILATIVMISVTGAGAKSRDAKRKSDVVTIKAAVDRFHVDNDKYPICISTSPADACKFSDDVDLNNQGVNGVGYSLEASDIIKLAAYLPVFPTDPSIKLGINDKPAYYAYADIRATGEHYSIGVAMEILEGNLSDSVVVTGRNGKDYYLCKTSTDPNTGMWAETSISPAWPNCNF